MDEIEAGPDRAEPERWAARPLLLAGLGLATGIVVHLILGKTQIYDTSIGAVQAALVLGITLGAGLIGFTIERRLWWAALIFGGAMGLVGYLIMLGNGAPGGWSAGEEWRMLSLVLALAIAAPLFQAARDEERLRPSYIGVHDHVWANIVLWCASWLFVAIVWLMAVLLANLFQLIKIHFLMDLLAKDWFGRVLTGLAFGSALGLLREHEVVVRTLQRAGAIVLAVLAPALAIGLALFLLALPFTGVQALWDATSATTPLLLACAAGALILCNVVIGRQESDERRNPLLRYGAIVLAAVILPLAVLAAVATGLRIGQYGYTPERLWGVVFVGIALCWGAAYFATLALRRLGWTQLVRPANLVLACLICVLGFLLATPLVSFNAISTRDQVARLESGKLSAEKFDWEALAFHFGKPGRDALARLRASPNPAIRAKAVEVAEAKSAYDLEPAVAEAKFAGAYDVRPAGDVLPEALKKILLSERACTGDNLCRVYLHDARTATVIDDACARLAPERRSDPKDKCTARANTYVLLAGGWKDVNDIAVPVDPEAKPLPKDMPPEEERALLERQYAAISGNGVTVRKVEMRQMYYGDKPQGQPFK